MIIQTWGDSLTGSFQNIWAGVVQFVPNLIAAVIILIVGWIVAALLGRLVSQIFKALKVDTALQQAGFESVVKRAGFNLDSGSFLGGLVKWFVIVAFLVAAFQVLGLTQVNDFLQNVVLSYLPEVIVAVLIILVAVVVADAMQKVVTGAARAAHIRGANFAGSLTKWAIWIVAFLSALYQLGIVGGLIQTLFTGFIVALSLAFGLSFGLGGQEAAAHWIAKFRSEITDKTL